METGQLVGFQFSVTERAIRDTPSYRQCWHQRFVRVLVYYTAFIPNTLEEGAYGKGMTLAERESG